MSPRILQQASRGANWVVLLELAPPVAGPQLPPVYVVAFHLHERGKGPQHWSRTDYDVVAVTELYDKAVDEFIRTAPVER